MADPPAKKRKNCAQGPAVDPAAPLRALPVELDPRRAKASVTTGEGVAIELDLHPSSAVLVAKQAIGRMNGVAPRDAQLFVQGDHHEEELRDEECLESLTQEAELEMVLLVAKAGVQRVVPELGQFADAKLGLQLENPSCVAFIPAHPDCIVVSGHYQVQICNVRSGTI
jgi:hypothetical protein